MTLARVFGAAGWRLLAACAGAVTLASCGTGVSCDASALFSGLEVNFSSAAARGSAPYEVHICLDEDCTTSQFNTRDGVKASITTTLISSSTEHAVSFRLVDARSKLLTDVGGSYAAKLESDSPGPCQRQAYVIRLTVSGSKLSGSTS